jgi:hypothetical protein
MLCERRVAVTVISWSASELTSGTVLAWSAAAALKETPLKIDAIATESFEFIVHPLENFFEVVAPRIPIRQPR